MSIFDNVEVCSQEDYDNFCRVNKNNMKRRSLTLFYTYLYKLNLLKNDDIFSLLDKLFDLLACSYSSCKNLIALFLLRSTFEITV